MLCAAFGLVPERRARAAPRMRSRRRMACAWTSVQRPASARLRGGEPPGSAASTWRSSRARSRRRRSRPRPSSAAARAAERALSRDGRRAWRRRFALRDELRHLATPTPSSAAARTSARRARARLDDAPGEALHAHRHGSLPGPHLRRRARVRLRLAEDTSRAPVVPALVSTLLAQSRGESGHPARGVAVRTDAQAPNGSTHGSLSPGIDDGATRLERRISGDHDAVRAPICRSTTTRSRRTCAG